jgi:hypothetical protein
MPDYLRADAALYGDEQTRAWQEWDDAVTRACAFGWRLGRLTMDLISANCGWGASSVAEADRRLYGPTGSLLSATKVTTAARAATHYDNAVRTSGLTGLIRELEIHGRQNRQVADAVAGWSDLVEEQRDAIAGAALSLRRAYLVAVGGGARPSCSPTLPLEVGE